jgi:hypothetical protein
VIAIEEALIATGWSTAIENMTKEEIVARFLSREIKLIDATPKFMAGKGSFAASKTEFTKRPGFKKDFKKSFKKDGFKKDGFKKDFKKSGFKSFGKKKTIEQRAD